jgi:ligand-binding sensor domain-containing protein
MKPLQLYKAGADIVIFRQSVFSSAAAIAQAPTNQYVLYTIHLMRASATILLSVLLVRALPAKSLPLRIFTPLDGLAGIAIHCIVSDSKGFLWFCTNEGLSRYDGYGFANYGTADGLADPNVYALLETRDGSYWVGTAAGLYRLKPKPSRLAVFLPPGPDAAKWIGALLEDPSGTIWVGTRAGLFRFHPDTERFESVELPRSPWINSLLRDAEGSLWVGTPDGLYRLMAAGVDHYSVESGLPDPWIFTIGEDAEKRLWVGTTAGLCRLAQHISQAGRIVDRVYTTRDGLPTNVVRCLLPGEEGTSLWAATRAGLAQISSSSKVSLGGAQGRPASKVIGNADTQSLARDRNGNLWIGTDTGGAAKLARNGFTSYGTEDGLGSERVISLTEDAQGRLSAVTRAPGHLFVNWFDGTRFHAVPVSAPPQYYSPDWLGWYQVLVQSRNLEWWAASRAGLLRFPATHLVGSSMLIPARSYDTSDGMGGTHVYQLFEDSTGHLWISTRDPQGNALMLRDPASRAFRIFSERDGLPSLREMWASGFFEDRAGQVWIGLHRAGVLRYARGRFKAFFESDGVPAGGIRRFHQDRNGHLWLGSGHGGIARLEDATAESPKFTVWSTAQGLSGNEIQAITEDRWGRIYIGTGNRVDRLDPLTGRVRAYTEADGLSRGEVQTAICDRKGVLWFGTAKGLSTLVPAQDAAVSPPPIRIMRIRISGIEYPLHEAGDTAVVLPNLAASRNVFEVAFTGLSFTPGEALSYEYRLDGVDGDWNKAMAERSVTYAHLPPGQYRFVVRAIDSSGVYSGLPATVLFRIISPFWMRWWFFAMIGCCGATVLYAAHRYRTQQLLRVERLRMRLASDVHDEIGSGLSQIAVLSELARTRLNAHSPAVANSLERVVEISRELLSSISDLVWAIKSDRDRLGDLTSRMRRFASETLGAAGIEVDYEITGVMHDQKIDFEKKRQIYLIFRESIRNILRHSECKHVFIQLVYEAGQFTLILRDDGVGFRPSAEQNGCGLASMRERARSLGGQIEWSSNGGTTMTLRTPT